MKAKSIFQCAALLTGLLLFNDPLFATVESDIVGYTEVTLKPGFNLLAVPFTGLSSDAGVDVQKLLQGTLTKNDAIQYWDGTRLVSLKYRISGSNPGKWYLGTTALEGDAAFYLKPGQGFWYQSNATEDTVVKMMGRVALTSSRSISVPVGLSLVGPTVPCQVTLADITFDGIANNTTIQYWNGTRLVTLKYRAVSSGTGWYLSTTLVPDHTILPAEGFWITAKAAMTITFPDPTVAN